MRGIRHLTKEIALKRFFSHYMSDSLFPELDIAYSNDICRLVSSYIVGIKKSHLQAMEPSKRQAHHSRSLTDPNICDLPPLPHRASNQTQPSSSPSSKLSDISSRRCLLLSREYAAGKLWKKDIVRYIDSEVQNASRHLHFSPNRAAWYDMSASSRQLTLDSDPDSDVLDSILLPPSFDDEYVGYGDPHYNINDGHIIPCTHRRRQSDSYFTLSSHRPDKSLNYSFSPSPSVSSVSSLGTCSSSSSSTSSCQGSYYSSTHPANSPFHSIFSLLSRPQRSDYFDKSNRLSNESGASSDKIPCSQSEPLIVRKRRRGPSGPGSPSL
ncbi:hypothetical protein V1511DRAFT_485505 [Dipodascopsis uninucleata]